jgi:hypothetical protein
MLRIPKGRAPWLTARHLFFNTLADMHVARFTRFSPRVQFAIRGAKIFQLSLHVEGIS